MGVFSSIRRVVASLAISGLLPACGANAYVASGGSGGGGNTGDGGAGAGTSSGGGTGVTGTTSGGEGGAGAGTGGGAGAGGGVPAACASDIHGKPLTQGNGDGYTLLPAIRISVPQDSHGQVVIGDVTGDGRADIVGAETDHHTLYRQTGAGPLAAPEEIPHDWYNPGSIALVQADANGTLDIATIGEDGMEIFASRGGGTFEALLFPTFYGYALHVVDLDFDGDDDLVWHSGWGIAHSYGDGMGAFTEPVQILDNPQDVTGWLKHADMTGDMIPDIVAPDSYTNANLVIVPHDGLSAPASTGWALVPFTGEPISGYDIGDVNADGLTDVAWQDDDNGEYDVRTHLMVAEPGGGFAAPVEICKDGWGSTVKIGDVNADGRNDVVAIHDHRLSVMLSTPAGMAAQMDYDYPSPASTSGALAIGDVDCDGCPDVVGADVGGLVVFYGQGCSP